MKARRADSLACAVVLLALLGVALAWHPDAVAALVVGVGASVLSMVSAHLQLAGRIAVWAAFTGMSGLPEVARWQARLVSAKRRRQLAARLRAVADAGPAPVQGVPAGELSTVVLADRAQRVRRELLELACAVERSEHPNPVTIARLWQLVGDGNVSPLYNPAVPAGELEQVLRQARWWLAVGD